jgi:hypothetical protein
LPETGKALTRKRRGQFGKEFSANRNTIIIAEGSGELTVKVQVSPHIIKPKTEL